MGNKIPAGLKNLFLIHFIVALVFGLGYLLVPQTTLGFVWPVLGTLVMLYALLFAGFPAGAWLNAIILAAFAVAFGIYYFRK